MPDMTAAETRTFLEEGTRTAKLAIVRKDGRPYVTPVWFVLDGEDVVFTTGASTLKGKALRRDGRAAICVDDERPPFAYVRIEGEVELSEDPDALLHPATVIGGRYMGADKAEAFGRRNAVPGELLVRLTPVRVTTEKGVADEPGRPPDGSATTDRAGGAVPVALLPEGRAVMARRLRCSRHPTERPYGSQSPDR